jgi:hypothetical protein
MEDDPQRPILDYVRTPPRRPPKMESILQTASYVVALLVCAAAVIISLLVADAGRVLQPLALFILLPAAVVLAVVLALRRREAIARRRRADREAAGLCPICGYDLRGSPRRCPECGSEPPELYRQRLHRQMWPNDETPQNRS